MLFDTNEKLFGCSNRFVPELVVMKSNGLQNLWLVELLPPRPAAVETLAPTRASCIGSHASICFPLRVEAS